MGQLCVGLGILSLLAVPAVVSADPVSFTYQINVTQKCSATGCSPYAAAFPLTLSFDAGITSATTQPDYVDRFYGAPTFSSVALDRPDVFAGASEFASTADIALVVPPFDWRHVAQAQRGAQLITADFDYRWYLGIYEVQDFFTSTPVLSAASFATFLGSGRNSTAFGYSFAGLDRNRAGELSPDSVGYSGTAILQDQPTVVPEPMSLLLAGTGLAAIGARIRRRNRR